MRNGRKMGRTLELFAGTCSFSKVAKELGYETFTTDYDPQFDVDVVCDIMEFDFSIFPKPDIIWASPPCTSFSVASIGKHWNRDHTPKTKEAKRGLLILKKTIEIIKFLSPKYFFIENPRGKMRKVISGLPPNTIRRTVTYCQYGDKRMKPTDIWTNCSYWIPRSVCKNGDLCHEVAPRGGHSGTQGIVGARNRSIVPNQLCREILLATKSY
jgi:hypothetical protein